ncbi:MAG TPA: agmatine deiminase family protein [Planctomycetota bacterium]|nr:agmatine deiminase family protein [Planctomycetota bacterium]
MTDTAEKPPQTPAELGYRMPAEWERHEATWLGWPHNLRDWPGKMEPIQWVFGEIVRHLAAGEQVRLLIQSKPQETQAVRVLKRAGVDPRRVEFFACKTNRSWARDFGPIFIQRMAATGRGRKKRRELAVAGFRFNGWAKYRDWERDTQVAGLVARAFHLPFFFPVSQGRPVVLEGGAIDVNGRGTLLTTEECLLDTRIQVRNPGLGREGTEQALRDYLGVTNVIWLGKGIAGDLDTHGHVDDLCRFINPDTVVLCQESNSQDANYAALRDNRERLKSARLENGKKIKVIELPMPAPLYFDGRRLPASYANFYIANAAVLVPTFNDPMDRIALGILADCFPKRPVIGIHAVDLVWGLGTVHCLSQQQPAV